MNPSPISVWKSMNLQVRLFQSVQRHGGIPLSWQFNFLFPDGVESTWCFWIQFTEAIRSFKFSKFTKPNVCSCQQRFCWRNRMFEALLLPFDAGLICLPWQLVRRTESQPIESRYEIQFASLQPESTVDACTLHILACCFTRSQIQMLLHWLVLPSQNAETERLCHHSLLKLHVVHVLATNKSQLEDVGSNLANLQSLAGATNFAFVKGDVLWLGWFWKAIEAIDMFWTFRQSDLGSEFADFKRPFCALCFISSCCF